MRTILIILLISLCITGTGCQSKKSIPPLKKLPLDSADMIIDLPTKGPVATPVPINVTFAIPDGFERVDDEAVHYRKDSAHFIVKEESDITGDLDDIMAIVVAELQSSKDSEIKTEIGDILETTIDGEDAREITYAFTDSGIGFKYRCIYTIQDGTTYQITYMDSIDSFGSCMANIDHALETMHFSK